MTELLALLHLDPVTLAVVTFLAVRVEQLHRNSRELGRRVHHLEQLQTLRAST